MPLSSSIEWHRIQQPTSDKPGANHGQLGRPGRLAKLAAGLLQTEELVWQPGLLCVGLGHLLLHASCDAAQLLAAGRRVLAAALGDARPAPACLPTTATPRWTRPGTTGSWSSRTSCRARPSAAAQPAHHPRLGGYLLEQIAPLIAQVRTAGGLQPLEAALRDWRGRLSARGRAMLAGAAALEPASQSSHKRMGGLQP